MERIVCKICGGPLEMRIKEQDLQCQNCGIIYPCELFVEQTVQGIRTNINKEIATEIPSYPEPTTYPISTTDPNIWPTQQINTPHNWHTSYGASCGGILAAIAIGALIAIGIIGIIFNCIYFIVAAVYAFFIYPRYFSDKSPFESSKTISFFNMMFGGLVFGCIWNANLTKQKKGFSNIVCGILSALVSVSLLISAVMFLSVDPLDNIEVNPGSHIGRAEDMWIGAYQTDEYDRAQVDEYALQALMDMGLSFAEASRIVSKSFEDNENSSITTFTVPTNFRKYTFSYSYGNEGFNGGSPEYKIMIWDD